MGKGVPKGSTEGVQLFFPRNQFEMEHAKGLGLHIGKGNAISDINRWAVRLAVRTPI